MTCPNCTQAKAQPWHQFTAGCKGCEARALSRSPQFVESKRRNRQTPEYRAALAACGLTHEAVLVAAKAYKVRGDA